MAQRLLTAQELLDAPTGVDWSTIAESSSALPLQTLEQSLIIDSATAAITNWCNQRLDATTDTEFARLASGNTKVWVDTTGWLWFRPDYFPVLSISAFQWAIASAGTTTLTYNANTATQLAAMIIYGEGFRLNRVADLSQDWTWLKWSPGMLQMTYVNGWPNAVTATSIASGSSVSVTVDTTIGMSATAGAIGNSLTIYDGASTETVTVSSVTNSTTVVLSSVTYNHTSTGLRISAIPNDVRQAVIETCVDLARQRGTDALVMGDQGIQRQNGASGQSVYVPPPRARSLLQLYRRVI